MRTLAAGQFKANCLALINEIAQSRESIIITRYGKPIAKVVPLDEETEVDEKPLKGAALFIGDIISPIDEEWEAMK